MKLSRLRLYDFRNYKQLQLELDPGVNLIIGENAQGKTNLTRSCILPVNRPQLPHSENAGAYPIRSRLCGLNCRRIFAGTGAVRSQPYYLREEDRGSSILAA